MLTVLSWNMNQNQRGNAWERLHSLVARDDVSLALVQEAKWPERLHEDWRTHPSVHNPQRWRIAVPASTWHPTGSCRRRNAGTVNVPSSGVEAGVHH